MGAGFKRSKMYKKFSLGAILYLLNTLHTLEAYFPKMHNNDAPVIFSLLVFHLSFYSNVLISLIHSPLNT
jgi:hypothetical protein